jgi:hypothetical protein
MATINQISIDMRLTYLLNYFDASLIKRFIKVLKYLLAE